jgi:mannosyltransferase
MSGGYTRGVTQRRAHPLTYLPVLVAILLLAAWLRLYHLDHRPLWFDEGIGLTFARLPLADYIAYNNLTEEVNPPAYHLLLGGWVAATGTTALAARWLSGVYGLLVVALTCRIGRRLIGGQAALIGALLVAIAPMQVYYSQEAKGYTHVAFWLAVGLWAWLYVLDAGSLRRRGLWLAASGLATFLAVGAHYVAALLIVTQAGLTLVWAVRERYGRGVRRAVTWAASQAAAGLALAPWLLLTASATATGSLRAAAQAELSPRGLLAYLWAALSEFVAGPGSSVPLRVALVVVALALAGLGLAGRPGRSWGRQIVAAWLIGPLALGFGLQIAVPFFFPRFLLYVTPALWLLVGGGVTWLARRARVGALIALLGLIGLLTTALVPQYARPMQGPAEDYRPLVATLLASGLEPEDALIYSYHWQPGLLHTYLPDGREPTYVLSFFEPDTFDERLADLLAQHEQVWFVTYRIAVDDPIQDVGRWLLGHAAHVEVGWYGDSQLNLFIAPQAVANPGPANQTASFDGGRIVLGYAPLEARAASGELLGLTLTWEAREALTERYVVFVHLVGVEGAPPVAQQDIQPVNGLRPTYTWLPGEIVRDYHALIMPQAEPGHVYSVLVGMYDADTLARLPVDGGGDSVRIGSLTVEDVGGSR